MSHPADDRGRGWATDLWLVVGLAVAAAATLLLPGVPRVLEWLLAVPFLLVAPGYALVSALLPDAPDWTVDRSVALPGWPVRIGLSVALSVLTVGAIGVLLSRAASIRLASAVVAILAVTVGTASLASLRRRRRHRDRRAAPLAGGLRSAGRLPGTTSAQSLAFVLAVVALVGVAAFAGATPTDRQPYSEFYLLSADESGELVASDLPRAFVAGQSETLHVAVENHEHRSVSYEVVAVALSNGLVTDQEVIDRFDVRLEHGERAVRERTIAPETVTENATVEFRLYEDGAPARPVRSAADAVLRLNVEVAPSERVG